MGMAEGNRINFYQGTKDNLTNNIANMAYDGLAIATDESNWYIVKTENNTKTLNKLGGGAISAISDGNGHVTLIN